MKIVLICLCAVSLFAGCRKLEEAREQHNYDEAERLINSTIDAFGEKDRAKGVLYVLDLLENAEKKHKDGPDPECLRLIAVKRQEAQAMIDAAEKREE